MTSTRQALSSLVSLVSFVSLLASAGCGDGGGGAAGTGGSDGGADSAKLDQNPGDSGGAEMGAGGAPGSGGSSGSGGSGTDGSAQDQASSSDGSPGTAALTFDEGGVTRRSGAEAFLTIASLAYSGTSRILLVRAAGLMDSAAGPAGTPTGIQLGLFRMGEAFTPGEYTCASGVANMQLTVKGDPLPYVGTTPGSCTITLTMLPTATGQRMVGTFSGVLQGFGGPNRTVTNGRFDLVASFAAN